MPTISRFYGITIRMYFFDHPPAHFHAVYNGYEALIDIESGMVRRGNLPPNATRLVCRWLEKNRQALRDNWERSQSDGQIERIPGLDAD